MAQNLRIIPHKLGKGQTFEKITSVLTLSKAENFKVSIKEYLERLKLIEDQIEQKYVAIQRVSTKGNNEASKKNIAILNEEIAKLRAEKTDLKKEYDDINWAWQLVGNGIRSVLKHNKTIKKGLEGFVTDPNGVREYQEINFSPLIEGGGLAWLEVFSPTDPAVGKIPNGFFVRALGTPKFIRAEWTDFDHNPIKTKVRFGSELLLHIYTEAMYGQEAKIELFDRDLFDPNDLLGIANKKSFIREALVYKIQPNEDNKQGIDGSLIVKNDAGEGEKREQHVQKMVVEVLIDSNWEKKAGSQLKIFPRIQAVEKESLIKEFKDNFLEVGYDGVLVETPKEVTNLPVVVGEVETNAATFHPCRYDLITLKKQKGGFTELFNSKNHRDIAKQTIEIDIIAGKKETYLLEFDFKTDECPKDHQNKELIVNKIPENYEVKIDSSSKAEHVPKEKESKWVKTSLESSSSLGTIFGAKSTQKEDVSSEKGIVSVKQDQIEFDTFYNYDIPNNASLYTFAKAMKYFWLPELSTDKILRINSKVSTCAFNKNIAINIYPDIKWTLKFGFNVSKDDIEALNRKGGTFAPFKTFEEKAEKKDEEYFKNNEARAKALKSGSDSMIQKYDLKPKKTIDKPVDKGTSFKKFVEIISRITLSLEEEHYGGDVKNELTEDFVKDLYQKISPAIKLAAKAAGILEGDFDKKDFSQENEKDIDGLMKKLNRKTVEYEFLYPKLSFAGSWFYEQIDASKYPMLVGRQGLGIDLMLKAAPLIGVTIKWDILELLARRHPIAYAILKAVDTLLYVLSDDESAIICDFSVTGKIDTTIDFQHNLLAGFKDFNAKSKSSIQAKIELELRLNNTVKFWGVEAYQKLGFSTGASSGLGIQDQYGVDSNGFYVQKDLIFEGIKFEFTAEANAGLVSGEGEKQKSIIDIGGKIDGEITMFSHTFTTDKMYFNKTI